MGRMKDISMECMDIYSDVAYLLLFPHLEKWVQVVLLLTILLPINFAAFLTFNYNDLSNKTCVQQITTLLRVYFRQSSTFDKKDDKFG